MMYEGVGCLYVSTIEAPVCLWRGKFALAMMPHEFILNDSLDHCLLLLACEVGCVIIVSLLLFLALLPKESACIRYSEPHASRRANEGGLSFVRKYNTALHVDMALHTKQCER